MTRRKASIFWLAYTVCLYVLQLVYLHYGHGATSKAMSYVWLPAFAYFVCVFFGMWDALISAGVWTLTMGMFLAGVFQIAGTGSPFLTIYWVIGAAICAAGLARFFVMRLRGRHARDENVPA